MAGRSGGAGTLVAGVAAGLLFVAAPTGSAGASAGAVTAARGGLTPGDVAEIHGAMPKGKAFKPARFVLSHDGRFNHDDAPLGTKPEAASRGHFRAWVALPDVIKTGSYRLLACQQAKPTARGCVSVMTVNVRPSSPIPAATPMLDTGRATTATLDFHGGSVSVTAADGTTFTLTVPDHSVQNLDVTMTPVTSLAPASAVGRLVDGVMIEPLGSAPAGSTLQIHRATVPQGARAVAFGGVDPSNGAFPLPLKVTTDTRIAVSAFGGYGIAVPAAGESAEVEPRSVPCQTASPAGANGTGAQPLMNCIAVAQRLRAMSEAERAPGASLASVFAAAAEELAGEVSKVTSLPPTDEGDAELQLLLQLAIGVQRQAELAGVPSATAALDGPLKKALEYHLNKLRSVCMGGAQHSSELYLEYTYEAIFDERQIVLNGGPTGDIEAIITACLDKVKLQLTGNDDATVDNGEWTEHVFVRAVATITGSQDTLVSDTPGLIFTSATSQADPPLIAEGGTATTTSASGKMHGEQFGFDATRRVRCDKNKKLIVERKAYLHVTLFQLWEDSEQVAITINGVTVMEPSSAATQSWFNDYYSRQQRARLEIGGAEDARADNGTCRAGVGCLTFSYSGSLKATALQN